MTQGVLFARRIGYGAIQRDVPVLPAPAARHTDPTTSQAAARRAAEFAASHAGRILEALRAHGPMTADEIARVVELLAHQVNKRLPELERAGLARPTGATRASAAGVPERIWEAGA